MSNSRLANSLKNLFFIPDAPYKIEILVTSKLGFYLRKRHLIGCPKNLQFIN